MPSTLYIGAFLIMELVTVNALAQTGTLREREFIETDILTSQQSTEVALWRAAFRSSGEKTGRIRFQELMREAKKESPSDPKAEAFLAVAEVLVASRSLNPFSKWTRFNKWTEALDRQIQRSPFDADIRLIRLTIQANAPAFLGYKSEREEDCLEVKKALDDGFWDQDPTHKAFVRKTYSEEPSCQ